MACVQEQVQHVVSISMKLLLLMYYEVLEDACRMLMEMIKAHTPLLQPYMQPLIDCLLDVYNALPVEQQPSLMKHVERLMDFMAQHMEVHALMEVRPPSALLLPAYRLPQLPTLRLEFMHLPRHAQICSSPSGCAASAEHCYTPSVGGMLWLCPVHCEDIGP